MLDGYKKRIFIPLSVLMWKYTIMRLHRYHYTFIEIWGGVLIFVILFIVNQSLRPGDASIYDYQDSVQSTLRGGSLTKVFYTPYNYATSKLMSKVEDYLMKHKSDVIPNMQWQFKKLPKRINKNVFNTSHGIAVVKFKDYRSFQQDLKYTISVNDGSNSELDVPIDGLLRSDMVQEKSAPPFLGPLLWAIDKSYMDEISNENVGGLRVVNLEPEGRKYIPWRLGLVHRFMIICTTVSPLPYFLIHSTRLTIERRMGLRELMKLSGISCNVLRLSHFLAGTVIAVLYTLPIVILLKATQWPIVPYSSVFIIALTLIFHFLNLTSWAGVITALSQDFRHSESLSLMVYLCTFVIDFLWYSNSENKTIRNIMCSIFPHAPVYMFWDEVIYLESIGEGSQFSNIQTKHANNSMSVLTVWMFFTIQQTFISSIAWYLDIVKPGSFGISRKWNFLFKSSYWSRNRAHHVYVDNTYATNKELKRNERYFEKRVKKAEVAIKVVNVSKVFKTSGGNETTAVDSVTFDCYRGEITILLGTNGAGKTTLMSIVAGMFSATQGTVFIKGKDVAHKIMELREDLGFCTQKNLCFRYLTVKENIKFFHKLRRSHEGFTVEQLMRGLKLTEKANCFSNQLSRGMLRCLQVACTLAGGADVLILDEPTSGMEVEVRHHLWDLLMVLRGNKTILMTTTILEEANALGDRIVILNNGVLKCHGTPMFLKNAIGTSFNLSVTINDSTQLRHVKDIVDRIIPNAKFRVHDMRHITFSLPSKEYDKFSNLFHTLETNQREYGISLIDVGLFLEDVFLEFIEHDEESAPLIVHTHDTYRHIRMDRVRGVSLVIRRFKMLISRVFFYILLVKYEYFTLRILLPFIALIIVTLTTNDKLGTDKMFGGIYKEEMISPQALMYNESPLTRRALLNILEEYPGIKTIPSLDVYSDLNDPRKGYGKKETLGLEMTDNHSRIFYSSDPRVATASITMFSNMYMSLYMPYLNNTIRTSYQSMPYYYDKKTAQQVQAKLPKGFFLCLKWTLWVVILSSIPIASIIILSILELSVGSRDNHMMAGCTPFLHWGAKLVAHMIQYLIIIPIPVVLVALLLDYDQTFNQKYFLGSLLALLLAYGPTILVHLYFLSFILHENYAVSQIYLLTIFCGCVLPVLMAASTPARDAPQYLVVPHDIGMALCRLSPMFAFGCCLGRLTRTARVNAFCDLNRDNCPLWFDDALIFDSKTCCTSEESEPFKYFSSYDTGRFDLINLVSLFLFYSAMVILLENRIIHYILEQITFIGYKKPLQVIDHPNIRKEKEYVQTAIDNKYFRTDVLIADNIHKDFVTGFRRADKENVVKGVSFTVKLGDCLAILGPHGAGKSSLLKMLAGSQVMTRGDSCVLGSFIRIDRSKYIHRISLASSGGMDLFMTGRQNLVFIAKLQGYSEEMANKLSVMALRYMGLRDTSIPVSKYSSGCLHRLALCCTLVLAPPVVLLDEPMTDLDANTKPLVAKALMRLMLEPSAVVVTEASIDWRQMKTVFTRIAIMMNGQFTAIGQAEEILADLAQGYTARIKLKVVTAYREDMAQIFDEDSDSESEEEEGPALLHSEKSVMFAQTVVRLKQDFKKTFPTSILIAEHLCMLYYNIQDEEKKMLYSEMFLKLDKLKRRYDDVVEDYTLNSTTMEDVFWRFESENREGSEDSDDSNGAVHHESEDAKRTKSRKKSKKSKRTVKPFNLNDANGPILPKYFEGPLDSKNSTISKELESPKNMKERQAPTDPVTSKDSKASRSSKDIKDPITSKDSKDVIASKRSKDSKNPNDPKDESKASKDSKASTSSKDTKDPITPKDSKDLTASKRLKDSKNPKDPKDPNNSKDP